MSACDGAISIEYEGDGEAATGIQRTRELIEKYWGRCVEIEFAPRRPHQASVAISDLTV